MSRESYHTLKEKKKEATWLDLSRRFIPDATDKELDEILWNETSFPFGSVLRVARQLRAYAKKGRV